MSTPETDSARKARGSWSSSSPGSGTGSPRGWSNGYAIPTSSRRVLINDVSQLPFDYSTTPGGTTFFSTTPGGTRIIYERNFLMQMRNSPVAKTPPKSLPIIPGVTIGGNGHLPNGGNKENKSPPRSQAVSAPNPCTGDAKRRRKIWPVTSGLLPYSTAGHPSFGRKHILAVVLCTRTWFVLQYHYHYNSDPT